MSKVYVIQEPIKWDPKGQREQRKFDLTPASAYGELVFLLPSGRSPLNSMPMVRDLKRKLKDYSNDDYILPTGHPMAIGLAVAIAALNNNGCVKLLVWHGSSKAYVATEANVYGNDLD